MSVEPGGMHDGARGCCHTKSKFARDHRELVDRIGAVLAQIIYEAFGHCPWYLDFLEEALVMLMLVRGFKTKEEARKVLFHGIAVTSVWIAQCPQHFGIWHVDDNAFGFGFLLNPMACGNYSLEVEFRVNRKLTRLSHRICKNRIYAGRWPLHPHNVVPSTFSNIDLDTPSNRVTVVGYFNKCALAFDKDYALKVYD
jgi:hypothetical protein